jgi:hypothetical protein
MLPRAIWQLSQLQQLVLSHIRLNTLPEALQSLERLEKLFLHGNPSLGLPDEILGPTAAEVFGPQKRSPNFQAKSSIITLQRAGRRGRRCERRS